MEVSVTNGIIVITCIVSFLSFNRPELMAKLIHNPFRVKQYREYHRLVTSGFIHGSIPHLAFNMITLYFFGPITEYKLYSYFGVTNGAVIYVVFYLVSIVISDLSSVIKFGDSPSYNSLGASGAVSAMLFVSILFYPLNTIYLMFILPIPGFLLGALYLIYSYFEGKRMADNINHNAHLYGAVAGIIFSILIYPRVVIEFFQQISTFSIPSLLGF